MNLKPEELVKSLGQCNKHETEGCQGCAVGIFLACENILRREAASQIVRDLKEIAELKAKVEQYRALSDGMTLIRLRELAVADKDGRVIVLPCKVGDTVWFKTYKNSARDCIGIQPHEVTRIEASIIVPGEHADVGIHVDQIGVRAFLSRAEAVAADEEPPAGNAILKV